jgi:hypothetical protein
MLLVVSCIVLIWGIFRLVRLNKSLNDKMGNKVIITMHIVAYLAIILVNLLSSPSYSPKFRAFEIRNICGLAVFSMCTAIFGLIVN